MFIDSVTRGMALRQEGHVKLTRLLNSRALAEGWTSLVAGLYTLPSWRRADCRSLLVYIHYPPGGGPTVARCWSINIILPAEGGHRSLLVYKHYPPSGGRTVARCWSINITLLAEGGHRS